MCQTLGARPPSPCGTFAAEQGILLTEAIADLQHLNMLDADLGIACYCLKS